MEQTNRDWKGVIGDIESIILYDSIIYIIDMFAIKRDFDR